MQVDEGQTSRQRHVSRLGASDQSLSSGTKLPLQSDAKFQSTAIAEGITGFLLAGFAGLRSPRPPRLRIRLPRAREGSSWRRAGMPDLWESLLRCFDFLARPTGLCFRLGVGCRSWIAERS